MNAGAMIGKRIFAVMMALAFIPLAVAAEEGGGSTTCDGGFAPLPSKLYGHEIMADGDGGQGTAEGDFAPVPTIPTIIGTLAADNGGQGCGEGDFAPIPTKPTILGTLAAEEGGGSTTCDGGLAPTLPNPTA
jgi:hypothetical protein